MKQSVTVILSAALLFAAGCSASSNASAGASASDINAKSEGVMTYAEYEAAALDSPVTVETYVQGKTSWWENKGTLYTQDGDGAYFIYDMQV